VALALLALAAVTPLAPARAAPRQVRLQPSGSGVVRFTVEVPEARIEPVADAQGMAEIRIQGYGGDGAPGAPALPTRILQVAVPPLGEVSLRVSAGPGETREGVVLAPLGTLPSGRESEPRRFERSAAAYAASGALAPRRARLLGVSWLRNQRVATVAILPADYEPAARRVTLYREVEVELSIAAAAGLGAPVERADPFEGVYREVLVNYEQGRAWRRSRNAARAPGGRTAPLAAPVVPDTSVFAGRSWIKITIPQTGFYKLDFGQLRNFALFSGDTTVQVDSLRLFTWPGYPVLPEDNYCDACDYHEVAIRVLETGPDALHTFNYNSESIYFFALGPIDWADYYEPSRPDSDFVDHPYETLNYYYLTVATAEQPVARGQPARIASIPGAVLDNGTELRPVDFQARVHAEQDIEYFPDLQPAYYSGDPAVFWDKWFWRSMQVGNQFSPEVDSPGADVTQPATVRIRQWGISASVSCNDAQHLLDVQINGQPLPREGWTGLVPFAYNAAIPINALRSVGHNTVTVSVPAIAGCPGRADRSGLAWIELRYRRKFEPVADQLIFDTPASGGNYIYDVGPFTSSTAPQVFDVTDGLAPVEITPVSWSTAGGVNRLSFETVETGVRRYRVLPAAGIVKVPDTNLSDAPVTSLQNLRSATGSADYLLIYYDGFKAAADSLADWRVTHLPLDTASPPYQVTSVPISALYDQFSGGRTDPAAIRNFLRATFYNWQKTPAFVTILGDASYDFKNIKGLAPAGQPGCLVPSYENGFAIAKQFATDDWMLNVDDIAIDLSDFFGGRIPAVDARTALDFVQKKVLFYERQAPLGTWRNTVMLIADDNLQHGNPDVLGWKHLSQTADLDSSHTPRHVDRAYVYLHTYADGPGDTKPGAKADIKQTVNDGVLMFNYIGHGSPFKIADETVMSDVDAGTFTNSTEPALFVAASCDVGKFSDPTVQSLGERMVLAPTGGAIAVISATELAYSDLNVDLNWELYDRLFDRRPATGQYHIGVGEALLTAKIVTWTNAPPELKPTVLTNNSKYQVMGDAATRLDLPRLWVDLTLHACDTCSAVLPEAPRGQAVVFRGRVLDRPGGTPVALDGTADVLIEDSAPLDHAPDDPNIEYWFRAGPMFRGDAKVVGGLLSGKFVVPIEARGGAHGRVRAYVRGRSAGEGFDTDAVGSNPVQVSPGPPVTGDNEGPRITLSFASGSTTVRPDAVLRVDLFDPSGILITGHSLQNGIVVTLDGNTTGRVDITPSFRYLTGSYSTGTATWQLPNLAAGAHSIRVSAADNLAAGLTASSHRSSATVAIEVAESPPVRIVNAYLFPNPTSSASGGQFVVDALGDSVNSLLRIYTVTGRLVRTLESFARQGQIQIAWDGLDGEGHVLANGPYLFRVQLNLRDDRGKSSALQKAAAQGRFVILNR